MQYLPHPPVLAALPPAHMPLPLRHNVVATVGMPVGQLWAFPIVFWKDAGGVPGASWGLLGASRKARGELWEGF